MLTWLLDKLLKRAQTLSERQYNQTNPKQHATGIDELVREGHQFQVSGDLEQAELLYRKILYRSPEHADTLYLLATIQKTRVDYDQAQTLIQKAIAVNPQIWAYHALLAEIYSQKHDLPAAEACLREAIRLEDSDADLLSELGTVVLKQRRFPEAHEIFRRALALDPEQHQALFNTGVTYRQQGLAEEALPFLERAMKLQPDYAQGYMELAEVSLFLNKDATALDAYQNAFTGNVRALESAERMAGAFFIAGELLTKKQDFSGAIDQYQRSVECNPEAFGVWLNLGNAHKELRQFEDAMRCYLETLQLNPACEQAYCNIALVLQENGGGDNVHEIYRTITQFAAHEWPQISLDTPFPDMDIALNLLEYALSLAPDTGYIYLNKSVLLENVGRFDEAMTCLDKAMELEPDSFHTHFNKGIALLRYGQMEMGWKEYDARLNRLEANIRFEHFEKAPLWTGQNLTNESLLIHAEQGLGDTIQFIRYHKDVSSRCPKVIFEAPEPVRSLIADIVGSERVYAAGSPLPAFDYQIPMMSLPRVFGTRLDSIPAEIPYIFANPEKATQWQAEVARHPGLYVGLVWAGGAVHKGNRLRSCSLNTFSSLAECQGVTFFSLQKGEPVQEMKNTPAGMTLVNCSDQIKDFQDTAALIANLDLVVTVDTSVAHLAGAMGKPVWVLIPFNPDWRWMLNRVDSPWYPTMRLYRQSRLGTWVDCIERMQQDLNTLSTEAR